jgi:acyl-CoA thioesterase
VRVNSAGFLGLERVSDDKFALDVVARVATGGGFLFGGAGLGAGIAALEAVSQRRCVWATAQYLSYAMKGSRVTIDVTLAVQGHQISQGRAVCRVGDKEILTVNAALGDRPFDASGQFLTMPVVDPPDACRPRIPRSEHANSIMESLEQRVAKGRDIADLDGTPSDGRTILWSRIPAVIEGVDAATLAILGDFVPMGIGQALGLRAGGNSLDNTLRIVRLVPTEWVLLDIRIDAVQRGFGHGSIQMFATDGTLMATASQSTIARHWRA